MLTTGKEVEGTPLKLAKDFGVKGETCVSRYESLGAFMRHHEKNLETITNQDASGDEDHKQGGYLFFRTKDISEMIEILKTGDDEIKQGLKDATKISIKELDKELMSKTNHFIPDVEGLFFDVAKVLSGEPEAWYRRTGEKNIKPKIYVPILGSYSYKKDAKEMIKNASKIIALVKALEDRGFEVQVDMVFSAHKLTDRNKNAFVSTICMKGYSETFNFNKLSAMMHPSFFRRLIFREMELAFPTELGGYYGIHSGLRAFEESDKILAIEDITTIDTFKERVIGIIKEDQK